MPIGYLTGHPVAITLNMPVMGIQFAVYSAFILLIRWVFYLSPRGKNIGLYAIKAIIEIAAFLLLFKTSMAVEFLVAALLLALNLFSYAIEVKVASVNRKGAKLQTLELFAGLAIYAVALILIFQSGKIEGFSEAVKAWSVRNGIPSGPRFYFTVAAGFLAVSESEHLFRFFRIAFAKADRVTVTGNGAYQAASYAERIAVLLLIFISQFTAAGIVVAGRLLSAGWSADKHNHVSLTMLSLTWALAWALALKFLT